MLAQEEARLLDHNFIGTEHILLGLMDEGEGVAAKTLKSLGIGYDAVHGMIEEMIGPAGSARTGSPPFTPRAKQVLELSLREALQLGHNYIGTEHILLGLVREGEGVAVQVLVSLGADLSQVRQQVMQLLSCYQAGGGPPDPHEERSSTLTQWAIPPNIGRMWRGATSVRPRSGFAPPGPTFMLSGEVKLTRLESLLRGTVAGNDVDFWLADLYEGRARGTIADMPMGASWQVGDPETWGGDVPIRVQATCGDLELGLVGWIHHEADLGFDHAHLDGGFAGQPVTAFVTSGDPGDDSGTFAAHGVFVDSDFSLRGHVSCGSDAAIGGSISGRAIDLRAEASQHAGAGDTIIGRYDGPAPLLLGIVATALYFL